ncbi:MAG: hypothetical protein N2489_02715 [Clostridia bacterium]|nr:hypothetical protein [Clostridia bacterium]
MKQKRSCSNCINGTSISINSDILCRINGAVSPDYACMRHRFMPEPKAVKSEVTKCIECEYFLVEAYNPDGDSTIGLCQLLTHRQFDGGLKKACSKFIKKAKTNIS